MNAPATAPAKYPRMATNGTSVSTSIATFHRLHAVGKRKPKLFEGGMGKLVFIYSEPATPPDGAWDRIADLLHSLFPLDAEATAEALDTVKDPADLRCLPVL